MRLSDGFDAQNASNIIWAAATIALEDARVINASGTELALIESER
jgi:hypothetical protein